MNKKKMHNIFKKLVSFFEEKDITYWLDSGTLLGFAREGDFLDWDNDIDISVLVDDFIEKADINEFKSLLNNQGYESYVLFYNKNPFLVKFTPSQIKKEGLVDISVFFFRKSKNFFWVPGWSIKGGNYKIFDPRYFIYGFFRLPLKLVKWHNSIGKCDRDNTDINSLSRKFFGKITTVVYPEKLIGNPVSVDWAPGKVPRKLEEYLSYRYGNWRIPNKDWDCYKDDRAYRDSMPENIL